MIEVKHWENGNIESVVFTNEDGDLHNPNGPAVQTWHENNKERYRAYFINGKWHNPNGPAEQDWHKNGQESYRTYWVDGNILTEEDFLARQNTVKIVCEGKSVRISRESAKSLNLIKE